MLMNSSSRDSRALIYKIRENLPYTFTKKIGVYTYKNKYLYSFLFSYINLNLTCIKLDFSILCNNNNNS